NYSPRIIEVITEDKFKAYIPSKNFYETFKEILDNPEIIWLPAFEKQITDLSKFILLVLLSLSDSVERLFLIESVKSFLRKNNLEASVKHSPFDFDSSFEELENTFIRIEKNYLHKFIIKLQNPSVNDFLLNYL